MLMLRNLILHRAASTKDLDSSHEVTSEYLRLLLSFSCAEQLSTVVRFHFDCSIFSKKFENVSH